jgi:hypothetical protein
MERRREPRFDVDQEARVTLLGDEQVCLDARVVNMSGRGMSLLLDRPVAVNSLVRIDLKDAMLLGEVCYSVQQGERHAIGVNLEEVISNFTELARLAEAVREQVPRSEEPAGVKTRRAG